MLSNIYDWPLHYYYMSKNMTFINTFATKNDILITIYEISSLLPIYLSVSSIPLFHFLMFQMPRSFTTTKSSQVSIVLLFSSHFYFSTSSNNFLLHIAPYSAHHALPTIRETIISSSKCSASSAVSPCVHRVQELWEVDAAYLAAQQWTTRL